MDPLASRRAASSPRKAPVPILFELRNLSAGANLRSKALTGETLFGLLQSALLESAVYHAGRGIEDLEHGAGFLILLDGLDEVPDALSKSIVRALLDMCKTLERISPKSTVWLSSRSQYFFSRYSRDLQESFDVLSVRPFTVGDIYSFLTKWPFAEPVRENITRIFSRLRQLPSLTEMCTNPLALSMFVARDQQMGGSDLPETRSRFYESLLEELIINRRSRGEGLPAGRQRLRDVRQAILGRVCLEHLLSRDEAPNSIPQTRFISAIRSASYGGKDAEKALLDLSSDTGLFAEERSGETERFMHLTLCEFLAAVEVVETGDDGWQRLLSLFGESERFWESRLAEVVAFACGLAGRALRQRILADLSRIKTPQVTLKAIIEAQAYDEEVAYRSIDSECRYITRQSPDNWNAEWFARLRTIVGVLRDAHAGRSVALGEPHVAKLPTSSGFLMNLIERYNAEEALLETLARQDADAAISIASETRRRDLMDHVSSAADDFAVLQGILSKCDAGDSAWRAALCERALTDRSIARILSSIQAKEITHGTTNSPHGWAKSGIIGDSAYGSLLDQFLVDTGSWSDSMSTFLAQMSRVKAPSFWRLVLIQPSNIILIPLLAMVAAFGVFVLAVAAIYPAGSDAGSSYWEGVAGVVLFTLFSIFMSTFIIRNSRRIVKNHKFSDTSAAIGKNGSDPVILLRTEKKTSPPKEKPSMKTGIRVRIDRASVLSEILNVAAYNFRTLDRDSIVFHTPKRFLFSGIVFYGVAPAELHCLLVARSLRFATSNQVLPLTC